MRRPACATTRPSISCSASRGAAVEKAAEPSRRAVMQGLVTVAAASLAGPAHAGVAEDLLKAQLRPEVDTIDAVVKLLDARGALVAIKDIAELPAKSEGRVASWRYVPAYARRLREVGKAAPVVGALVTGAAGKEAAVSEQFGGDAGATSIVDPLFMSVGQVLNYSGLGVRDEALATPEASRLALAAIEDLLGKVPAAIMSAAREKRAAGRT